MWISRWKAMIPAGLAVAVLAIGLGVWAQEGKNAQANPDHSNEVEWPGPLVRIFAGERRSDEKTRGELEEAITQVLPGRLIREVPLAKDCMVLAYLSDWSHGDVDNIGVASNDGGVRTLLSWPEINPEVVDSGLRFVVALYSKETRSVGTPGPILALKLRGDWPERTSWNTLPDYDPEPAASFKFAPGDGWKLFDVTPIIQAEARSGRKVDGIMLRFLNEDRSGRKGNWCGYQFFSRETDRRAGDRRPKLLVIKPSRP